MKTLTALFTAAALTLTAGLAQAADVLVDQIPQLVKDGKIKPLEELNQIVLKLHPGATITDSDLDKHSNIYEYEVELRDAKNVEWDVDLNAATGEVLKNKQDDCPPPKSRTIFGSCGFFAFRWNLTRLNVPSLHSAAPTTHAGCGWPLRCVARCPGWCWQCW